MEEVDWLFTHPGLGSKVSEGLLKGDLLRQRRRLPSQWLGVSSLSRSGKRDLNVNRVIKPFEGPNVGSIGLTPPIFFQVSRRVTGGLS